MLVCKRFLYARVIRVSTPYRLFSVSSKLQKPYLVTTPIFYPTASPHIGHLYTLILADILKRWQLLCGREAILNTGTDEHGKKVRAQYASLKPQNLNLLGLAGGREARRADQRVLRGEE